MRSDCLMTVWLFRMKWTWMAQAARHYQTSKSKNAPAHMSIKTCVRHTHQHRHTQTHTHTHTHTQMHIHTHSHPSLTQSLDNVSVLPLMLQLICRCWTHAPLGRPSFDQLRKSIQQINPNKESPVDMMMSMVSNWCDAGDIE